MGLRSMTTYARFEQDIGDWWLFIELKSVNHRFCDVNIRCPRFLIPVEDKIRKCIQKALIRGRVDVCIQMDAGKESVPEFIPNVELTRSYLQAVKELSDSLGLEYNLDISSLLSIVRDAIISRDADRDYEEIWKVLSTGLNKVLEDAISMAEQEASALVDDLKEHINIIKRLLEEIDSRRNEHLKEAQQALFRRIEELLGGIKELDMNRLHQEAAILADRLDITEEIVRAKSHISQIEAILSGEPPCGRRLDFLLQELFREVNTMASKSCDDNISQKVVEIKAELEILREQVQNLV